MKFAALLSGGKDSVFAIMEAERFGHELRCCAQLKPADAAADEVDSYCFQSAAHGAVAGVAECLGAPLVARAWAGQSTERALEYREPVDGDEVEDMYALLRDVKTRFPDVEAVSSGAILSTYQRTRVEHVCRRLGLTSLSYLWRRPQRRLLKDMARAGLRAIIVKTASMGLEPSHLGLELHLKSTRVLFERLHERFGFHEAGEGGEYESLVLDCPRFRKRLVLEDAPAVRLDDSPPGCGAVAVLSVKRWSLADKDAIALAIETEIDAEALEVETESDADEEFIGEPDPPSEPAPLAVSYVPDADLGWQPARAGDPMRGVVSVGGRPCAGADVAAQATAALQRAISGLAARGRTLADVFFVHAYLRDVKDFKTFNAAYVAEFEAALGTRPPPARSCVEAALPAGCEVLLEFEASDAREALHAPQCIGPYCQANILRKALVFAAGQIPLDAGAMTLTDGGAPLAFRHASSVLDACGASLEAALQVVIYVVNGGFKNAEKAALAAGVDEECILIVEMPALPAAAQVEVETVAASATLRERLEFAAIDGPARAARCRFLPRCFCFAAARVFPGGAGTLDEALALLLGACSVLLERSGLRREHWVRLRVFVVGPEATEPAAALLQHMLAKEAAEPPSVTVVPVAALEHGVCAAATLFACDLAALDADLWLERGNY